MTYCNRCANEAVFTQANHIPYWYCRTCKDEVYHPTMNRADTYPEIDKSVAENLPISKSRQIGILAEAMIEAIAAKDKAFNDMKEPEPENDRPLYSFQYFSGW